MIRTPEPRTESSSWPRRAGFTLVETLVSIGIIFLLVGLFLPAVQSARESARVAGCRNNLRQMAAAVARFEADHGGFPSALRFQSVSHVAPPEAGYSDASLHSTLLPYLEQGPLHDAINFGIHFSGPETLPSANETAASRTVSVFLCPSDPNSSAERFGCNSYRANVGVANYVEQRPGPGRPPLLRQVESGAFTMYGQILNASSFRDGLSTTVSLAEKSIGSGSKPYSPRRDWLEILPPPLLTTSDDEWGEICSGVKDEAHWRTVAGKGWLFYGMHCTYFTTILSPNSAVPDCGSLGGDVGAFTARSRHPDGVNAAMADGSVRWFRSSVSVPVWRALGTRAGGEVVALEE